MCFLGVGPDGHIASLFPDRPEILITDRAVVPVRDSPKPPPDRVSMTRPVINGSQRVWMVLSGADKASALGLALAGASYASVPAAGAKGRKRTVFFVDDAAASQVPPELIDGEYSRRADADGIRSSSRSAGQSWPRLSRSCCSASSRRASASSSVRRSFTYARCVL